MRRQVTRCVMVTLVLASGACAPAAVNSSSSAPRPPVTTRPTAKPTTGGTECGRASKVTIGSDGEFSPATLKLQRGAFIAVTNKSDESRELATEPDAGLVPSVLARRERQVIQFPAAGRFTVSSGNSSMRVTVSGESGCDKPQPTLTITDGYAFSPAKLSVEPTVNFTVVNESAAAHGILCDPDPGGNRDNTRLEKGETEILAFDRPGRYTCHSVQHPSAKVVVTVAAH